MIQIYSTKDIYGLSETLKKIDKPQCREFINKMHQPDYEDFDVMMKNIHEIYIIELNRACWENSTCTCREWHKTLKCKHIISLSTMLNLCTFSEIAYTIPLDKKRRRGRPKTMAPALQRQPSEYQEEDNNIEIC